MDYSREKHDGESERRQANEVDADSVQLRKNGEFHRLPHGGYGLREWYERIKPTGNGVERGDDEPDASTTPTTETT